MGKQLLPPPPFLACEAASPPAVQSSGGKGEGSDPDPFFPVQDPVQVQRGNEGHTEHTHTLVQG